MFLESIWDPTFEDRRQELTFIGISLDQDELTTRLDHCLLTESELSDFAI